jgi:hypothetical protein
MAHIVVQNRRRDSPSVRPNHGLLSRPRAPPQPRHPAMRKVTPPIAHRADMHPENCGDLSSVSSLQRQQNCPCPVRFAPMLRFRQVAQGGPFRRISCQRRFSRHACLHSTHPRQTIYSIVHSQAVCLVAIPLAAGLPRPEIACPEQGLPVRAIHHTASTKDGGPRPCVSRPTSASGNAVPASPPDVAQHIAIRPRPDEHNRTHKKPIFNRL